MADYKAGGTESRGKVVYNESIVKGIVAVAVKGVEGVAVKANKKGEYTFKDAIKIVTDKTGMHVTVTVSVLYGYNIPDVAYNIQHEIKQNVEAMSKYKITNVDVYVDDVLFEDKTV